MRVFAALDRQRLRGDSYVVQNWLRRSRGVQRINRHVCFGGFRQQRSTTDWGLRRQAGHRDFRWRRGCGLHVTMPMARREAKREHLPRALPEAVAAQDLTVAQGTTVCGGARRNSYQDHADTSLTPTTTPSPSACAGLLLAYSGQAIMQPPTYSTAKKCGAQPPSWWRGPWFRQLAGKQQPPRDKATCGYVCSQ